MSEKVDWKAKYEQAQKQVEALKLQLETMKETMKRELMEKNIHHAYEEKSEASEILDGLFGKRPAFGGGATLRWHLFRDLVKLLHKEKEGGYEEFLRRFSRQHGLTLKTLEEKYLFPLFDDKVIELFEAKNGTRWRWIKKVKE